MSEISLPEGFRVIDVIERRIVELDECSFVALSYVWGVDQRLSLLTALRSTIEDMKKEGGLLASQLPRTIEDAITVCIQLGHRYLWADRLCIIQDDADDKSNQIEAMGAVYLSADLVLIAAYGDSMDYGIPGVSHPRNLVQRSEVIHGLRITNLVREVEDDPLSVWDTRGWTYQEAVLSRRRLYFTNTRVFFECEHSVFHEDQFNPETNRDELISTRLTQPGDRSQFGSFVRHLKHYTSRKLTYRSDAYNALFGIYKSLYDEESTLVYGIPQRDFDRALLWFSDSGERLVKPSESQGVLLPSWSWSSHAGLSDQVRYQETAFYGTFVCWYSLDEACPERMKSLNTCFEPSLDNNWDLHMSIACSENCIENISFSFSRAVDSFLDVRQRFNSRWGDCFAFIKEAWPSTLKITELQRNQNDRIAEPIRPGVIAARCQTTSLRLVPRPRKSGLDIRNSKGEWVGEICGDEMALREEVISDHDTNREHDFIALSLSGLDITHPLSKESEKEKNYHDRRFNALSRVLVVNVLMIAWEGAFAQRRALGWIFLVDWAKLKRRWTYVPLQ